MTPDRAARARDVFDRALDVPPEDRAEFVARECANAPDVRADVDALLGAAAGMGSFLETPAADRLLGAPTPAVRLARGRDVGGFVVVRRIGEGGAGVVYEATQARPRRRVALKVLRATGTAPATLRRFLGEAEILARLGHPGIAHVYAAGVHEEGDAALPWIAMELVEDAEEVTAFAARKRLGVAARVRLLLLVCDAVQHAHEKGVVHRDVKPGNVLVGADGRVRVVDFGIAHDAFAGREASAAGTLAYVAPEQLAPESAGADVRSDVYSLGVLLYELLGGALPHDVRSLPIAEALRVKRDVAPAPLTRRAPQIPADLASAVHRALVADRARRYATVAAFADDLGRWMRHEPVAAHDGGVLYHARSFARRRSAVAAALVLVAAAIAVAVVSSVRAARVSETARAGSEFQSYVANVAAAATALRVHDAAEARRRLDRCPVVLRDWEWRHLRSRVDGSVATVRWEGRALRDGTVSADGQVVAALGSSVDPRSPALVCVGVWARDGRVLRVAPSGEGPAAPTCVALSADARLLAVGARDGTLRVEDARSGAATRSVVVEGSLVIDVAIAPRGDVVAAACADGAIRLFGSTTLDARGALRGGHGDRVICAAFSSDGATLFSGGRDGAVCVWDVAAKTRIATLAGHAASVEGVAPRPDGTRLATVSRDGTVRLWDLAARHEIARRTEHAGNVRAVAYAPDGATFATASWDGTVRVWDGATGEPRGVLRGHEGLVAAVAYVAGDAPVVSFSRDGTWRRWDPMRPEVATVRGSFRDCVASVAVSVGGDAAAVATADGAAWVLSVADVAQQVRLDGEGPVRDVAFVGPDRLVALRNEDAHPVVWTWDGGSARAAPPSRAERSPVEAGVCAAFHGTELRGWTVHQRTLGADATAELAEFDLVGGVARTRGKFRALASAFAAHDATGRLALGTQDGRVLVWNAGADVPHATAEVHAGRVNALAFAPDGATLVSAGSDRVACVLDAQTLSVSRRLEGHADSLADAVVLPGGRRFATASYDRTVKLWDAATGEPVLTLHDADYPLTCLAAASDGAWLLGGAGSMEDARSAVVVWSAPP